MNKYDEVLLATAYNFAELSYCKRLKVGAVIAKDGRPLVTGYNGTIAGLDNTCEEQTKIECKACSGTGFFETAGVSISNCNECQGTGFVMKTSDFVVHAEQNAIFYAAKLGLSIDGCTIYITHSPCEQCAKAIASAGIKRVVFKEKYRNDNGINFLKSCGVQVDIK
jgi:dCMP deaminase